MEAVAQGPATEFPAFLLAWHQADQDPEAGAQNLPASTPAAKTDVTGLPTTSSHLSSARYPKRLLCLVVHFSRP